MAVVINNNTRPFIIRETRQQIPCNGKFYVVPDEIACMYREQLLIIPPAVVVYIEKTNKLLEEEKERLDRERAIFEEEKKIYEPLFNKLNLTDVKNEKEWKAKVRRKKKYPKIDFLYSFHFNGAEKDKAIERLRESIKSIREQHVNICVCVTSDDCILKEIKDLADIRYYHKRLKLNIYCKPKTINIGVKKLVRTPYFIHSDIDLIYPKHHIEEMIKYTEYYVPVRVIFNNHNLGFEYQGKDYSSYKKFFNKHGDISRLKSGIAPGNGLIHLETFKKIQGYDEKYIGYGLEDADFNMRIAYINKMIELDDKRINTCHLYHTSIFKDDKKLDLYKKNLKYFQNKKKKLIEKIGTEDVNIFNTKYHSDLLLWK